MVAGTNGSAGTTRIETVAGRILHAAHNNGEYQMLTVTVSNDECLPKDGAQMLADATHYLLDDNDIGKVIKSRSDSKGDRLGDDAYFELMTQKIEIKVQ